MKRFLLTTALLATMIPAAAMAAEDHSSGSNQTGIQTGAQGGSAGASAQGTASAQSLSSADVQKIQEALREQGFFQGSPDGVWGRQTADALRKFQAKNQLNASGAPDTNTLNELGVRLSDTSYRNLRGQGPSSGTTGGATGNTGTPGSGGMDSSRPTGSGQSGSMNSGTGGY